MSVHQPLDHFYQDSIEGVKFTSTRNPELQADAFEALIQGLAPNNGLYIPTAASLEGVAFDPSFFEAAENEEEPKLVNLSIAQIAALVQRPFIASDKISNDELQAMMDEAMNKEIPFDKLDNNTIIAWLDQFETASFKDFAARSIAKLMEAWCEENQTPKNIVVATSGDTGVAIASAFAGSKWVTVSVMYPDGKVSPVQEAQMIKVAEDNPNVQCIPTEGDFDKCQAFSKAMQSIRDLDPTEEDSISTLVNSLKSQLNLTLAEETVTDLYEIIKDLELASANSINIWRLLPQMTQYFASYAKAVREGVVEAGEKIIFAVPTGNVGHMMAGMYAQQLGLPVEKFVVGTNANDIVTCALRDGELKHNNLHRNTKNENEALVTESPSMDIADPSNLERLLELARQLVDPEANIDFVALKAATKTLDPEGDGIDLRTFGVTDKILSYFKETIYASSTTDEETLNLMSRLGNRVELEPHGAAAVKALEEAREAGFVTTQKVVVLETASRDKFPEALQKAGLSTEKTHPVLKKLDTQNPHNPEPVLNTVEAITAKVKDIADESAKTHGRV